MFRGPYKPYTGIGSRKTPKEMLPYLITVAKYLSDIGYTLRSGGAEGADTAFETGARLGKTKPEIYLPWKGFNNRNGDVLDNPRAFSIASEYHPNWDSLSKAVKKLQARNSYQILGKDLSEETKSLFVLCWTPQGKLVGGTAQALRIAKALEIPVFNFGKYSDVSEIKDNLTEFFKILSIPRPKKY